jgi:hypothetical protein
VKWAGVVLAVALIVGIAYVAPGRGDGSGHDEPTSPEAAANAPDGGPSAGASDDGAEAPSDAATRTEGMVSCWSFDDGTGADWVGSNHGTVYSEVRAEGVVGDALGFDGMASYVDLGNPVPLRVEMGDFTYTAWIRGSLYAPQHMGSPPPVMPWEGQSERPIYTARNTLGGYPGNAHITQFLVREGKLAANIWGTRASVFMSGTKTVLDDTWHFVTLTKSASGVRLYVDGVLDAESRVDVGAAATHLGSYWIGRERNGMHSARLWSGELDEVAVFNKALSAAEVQHYYESGLEG